jgi:hypothetical protein
MKCSRCGLENRPHARFCKGCGQALEAPTVRPTTPTSPGAVCSACGATAKSNALFCPRCGQPLSPPVAAPTPAPTRQMRPEVDAQFSPPPDAQLSPPAPISAPVPTQVQLPTAATPETSDRRFPGWVKWAVIVVVLACLAIAVVTVLALGSSILQSNPTPAPMGNGTRSFATSPTLAVSTSVMWAENWLAPLPERR